MYDFLYVLSVVLMSLLTAYVGIGLFLLLGAMWEMDGFKKDLEETLQKELTELGKRIR
jgi:hypothetical protein